MWIFANLLFEQFFYKRFRFRLSKFFIVITQNFYENHVQKILFIQQYYYYNKNKLNKKNSIFDFFLICFVIIYKIIKLYEYIISIIFLTKTLFEKNFIDINSMTRIMQHKHLWINEILKIFNIKTMRNINVKYIIIKNEMKKNKTSFKNIWKKNWKNDAKNYSNISKHLRATHR